MKSVLLSILRDKQSSIEAFRRAADQLAALLAFEVAEMLPKVARPLETPNASFQGESFPFPLTLIPILRTGLVLMPPFLKLFPSCKVGVIGLKRDEETALPTLYYQNLPPLDPEGVVIILDPMIATGGSGKALIDILKKLKVNESRLFYVGCIAAEEGLKRLQNAAPRMKIVCGDVDRDLNDKKFIVPGLGDFGDRYFGTC